MDAILPADHGPGPGLIFGAAVLTSVSAAGAIVGSLVPLADTTTAESAFWGTVIAGVAGGGAWLASQAWKAWDERKKNKKELRQEKKEDESAQVAALQSLITRMESERKDLIRDVEELRDEVRDLTAWRAAAGTWIMHLEETLTGHDIKYRPWVDPPAPSSRYAPAPKVVSPGEKTP